jgi:hypothetical protein
MKEAGMRQNIIIMNTESMISRMQLRGEDILMENHSAGICPGGI